MRVSIKNRVFSIQDAPVRFARISTALEIMDEPSPFSWANPLYKKPHGAGGPGSNASTMESAFPTHASMAPGGYASWVIETDTENGFPGYIELAQERHGSPALESSSDMTPSSFSVDCSASRFYTLNPPTNLPIGNPTLVPNALYHDASHYSVTTEGGNPVLVPNALYNGFDSSSRPSADVYSAYDLHSPGNQTPVLVPNALYAADGSGGVYSFPGDARTPAMVPNLLYKGYDAAPGSNTYAAAGDWQGGYALTSLDADGGVAWEGGYDASAARKNQDGYSSTSGNDNDVAYEDSQLGSTWRRNRAGTALSTRPGDDMFVAEPMPEGRKPVVAQRRSRRWVWAAVLVLVALAAAAAVVAMTLGIYGVFDIL